MTAEGAESVSRQGAATAWGPEISVVRFTERQGEDEMDRTFRPSFMNSVEPPTGVQVET